MRFWIFDNPRPCGTFINVDLSAAFYLTFAKDVVHRRCQITERQSNAWSPLWYSCQNHETWHQFCLTRQRKSGSYLEFEAEDLLFNVRLPWSFKTLLTQEETGYLQPLHRVTFSMPEEVGNAKDGKITRSNFWQFIQMKWWKLFWLVDSNVKPNFWSCQN